MTAEEFSKETEEVREIFSGLVQEFPVCFCHNDMHPLNLVYNKHKGYGVFNAFHFILHCLDRDIPNHTDTSVFWHHINGSMLN